MMSNRSNAQLVIFIAVVGLVVFYYFNTAGTLDALKEEV